MQGNEQKIKPRIKVMFCITKGKPFGGAQKYVFDLAVNLPKNNFDVSVVHGFGDILATKLSEYSVPTFYIKDMGRDINFLKDIKSFFDLLLIFRKNKPDIVHLNSSKIGGIGALAARFAGVKKIFFTIHGFAFNEDRPWIQKKIIAFLSWLSIVFCTNIIFISKIEMDRVSKWPLIKNKGHLIYNGIETAEFLSKNESRKILAGIIGQTESFFENKIIIGTVGELTKNKGLKYAIEAVKNIPDCFYIIIGDGEEKENFQKIIVRNKLQEKIFLTGFVQNASQYLKAFDIFILPSVKEGLPYVLLEAGLAGLPVVASRVGGTPEIIDDGENGILVEVGNVSEIFKLLKNLALEPQKRDQLGSALHKKVEKEFSLGKMIFETEKFYISNL